MNSKRIVTLMGAIATCMSAAVAIGAIATFTPISATTIEPGTDVQFTINVSVESLDNFDAADIVIGSNGATDIGFIYSPEWEANLANVTAPMPDLQFYTQDVFVGGNNPTPVAIEGSLELGTVVVDTTGMSEGTYDVRIDPAVATGVSSLVLEGTNDGLQGLALFTIQCAAFDPQCDVDVDLNDYTLFRPCIIGPDIEASSSCSRFDATGDGHVDLADMSEFLTKFTGPS